MVLLLSVVRILFNVLLQSMIGLIALCHEDGSWDASDDELYEACTLGR